MMTNCSALGIVQIIVGILILGLTGIHLLRFWLGSVFLMVGIVTVVAVRFPSHFLLLIAAVLNTVSAALAMTGLGLYAWDMTNFNTNYYKMTRTVLDITMIIFLVLQFCVTLSFSVLTLKEMSGINTVKHLEFYKPLKEELTVSHVC
ncbi:uncharacterized protein tmem176l.3b [Danio aesculapii]|uniref:uncharacterized protein tmem176l.3b n=1 Tax=Danio aesculapii TaxID=1142201 RepID=UPI0024C01BBC|nr:uncharacterized protein tmem176l.3b [Danio aesculapii]